MTATGGARKLAPPENPEVGVSPDERDRLGLRLPLPSHVAVVELGPDDDAHLERAEEDFVGPRTVPARRREFALGRTAAREALRLLGAGRPPILVGRNREPLWPEGVVGSITHAAGFAIAAVTWRELCGGLGLDLEVVRSFPELGREIMTGAETEWLEALPLSSRERAAFELFSAKEAVYKAFFPRVGRFFGFEAVEAMPVRGDEGFLIHFTEPIDDAYPPSRIFTVSVLRHGEFVLTSLALEPDA